MPTSTLPSSTENDTMSNTDNFPHQFTMTASPSTDIWSKPPSTHRFNAPILSQSINWGNFVSVRVTIEADWTTCYEQGGLIMMLDDGTGHMSTKWIKAGIELVDGTLKIGVASKNDWVDWSLYPMIDGQNTATVEISKDSGGSLWVYLLDNDRRHPIRKVTWFSEYVDGRECRVGTYAAKPSKEGDALAVEFRDFVLKS